MLGLETSGPHKQMHIIYLYVLFAFIGFLFMFTPFNLVTITSVVDSTCFKRVLNSNLNASICLLYEPGHDLSLQKLEFPCETS